MQIDSGCCFTKMQINDRFLLPKKSTSTPSENGKEMEVSIKGYFLFRKSVV